MRKRNEKTWPPSGPDAPQPPGVSRRGVRQVRPLARRHAEAAVAALVAVMDDLEASPAARVSAASALLNWAYGKTATERKDAMAAKAAGVKVIKLEWADDRTNPREPKDDAEIVGRD